MSETIPIVSLIIPILAIGMTMSIPIIFLVLHYRKRRRLMELHHAERMAAIERGMEIPSLPDDSLDSNRGNRSGLLPGLIWLGIGVALIAGQYECNDFTDYQEFSAWIFIPTGVGLAYLIYYFVEGRQAQKRNPKRQDLQSPKDLP